MSTPSDCRRCGACCFSAAEQFVAVTGADWARLGAAADQVAHFIGNRAFMKMQGGHCTALRTTRTAEGALDFCCTVYDRRPQICRELERGSAQCEGERGKPVAIAATGANLFAHRTAAAGLDAAHAGPTLPASRLAPTHRRA